MSPYDYDENELEDDFDEFENDADDELLDDDYDFDENDQIDEDEEKEIDKGYLEDIDIEGGYFNELTVDDEL